MIKYHPDDNLLTEYASGGLAIALGVSVCAHLQLCVQCRQRVEQLNKLGAAILSQSQAEAVAQSTFETVIARIEKEQQVVSEQVHVSAPKKLALHPAYQHDPMLANLPKVIAKLLPSNGKLAWQRSSPALKTARLIAGQREYEVAFQRINSGGKVVEHDHNGMEITLVLHGSFSDEDGVYTAGDFLVRNPGEIHRPTATQNQDCLCLSVIEAPVKITGMLGKLINPFLSFKPA